ncbi:MAG: anhydro-N-acetylmuramic acid kinase [Chitinophagaceae bacterium]|nr:anhydro-N-acetylmuramic acid kinase [Chitinophagaceae bacterium]
MIYRAIGLMSGSSLDGLDIAYVQFHENAGKWEFDIKAAECYEYTSYWKHKLESSIQLNALNYQLLDVEFGHFTGEKVSEFINKHQLHYQVQLVASHGHTTFHLPEQKLTSQLGNGAAIAAHTGLPVITDIRAMDVALGGQGAPMVPVGDKLLFGDFDFCLNIGGIANVSYHKEDEYISFDVCPANRVLNLLANEAGYAFDDGGQMAESGSLNTSLLHALNSLDYYKQSFPKSLANSFGNDVVYSIIKDMPGYNIFDALQTYTEHIAEQVKNAVLTINEKMSDPLSPASRKMLVTGGGTFNTCLVTKLRRHLDPLHIELVVPDEKTVQYKEALIMALIGVLRWREENNSIASVTGATRSSIGGAIWMGAQA